ncbi:MAG: hypothetical protein ABIF71_03570 [Planctomycetota bacterium]
MKHILCAALITCLAAATGWGSSFFGIELANNVGQDTVFKYATATEVAQIDLDSGSSMGLYIGSEMALDFNLKLDLELGFHGGKYSLDSYLLDPVPGPPVTAQSGNSSLSYYSYVVMAGVRIKYDWQITDSISLEPYIMAGMTPLYQYSPSQNLQNRLETDLGLAGESFTFDQSNIWALNYYGFGIDVDLTRAAVEYSGTSKYLFGISMRHFDRAITFDKQVTDTNVNYLCLTATVLF